MKKWYQSALCKGILLAVECVAAAMIVIALMWAVVYPGGGYIGEAFTADSMTYERSRGFTNKVEMSVLDILNFEAHRQVFETKGKYNPDKQIDVWEYYKNENQGEADAEKNSGVVYRMGDLVKWMTHYDGIDYSGDSDGDHSVIVCQKQDGTFRYYTLKELKTQMASGELSFVNMEDESGSSYLMQLENGEVDEGDHMQVRTIMDKEGKVVFVDFWNFDRCLEELARPDGAESLLQIVNEDKRWNGRLGELYEAMDSTLTELSYTYDMYREEKENLSEGNTNLSYMLVDLAENKVHTNRTGLGDFKKYKENIKKMMDSGAYAYVTPKLSDFQTNMDIHAEDWKNMVTNHLRGDDKGQYVFVVAVDTKYPIQDSFYTMSREYQKYFPLARSILMGGFLSLALFVICFIWLTVVTGHINGKEGITLGMFDKIKTEIAAGGFCALLALPMALGASVGSVDSMTKIAELGVVVFLICAVGMAGYLSLVKRIKARTLWKNSILRWLLQILHSIWKNRKGTTKVICLYAGFLALQFLMASGQGFFIVIALAADLAGLIYLWRAALGRQRIRIGVGEIASGNSSYKIDTKNMNGEDAGTAQKINHIGVGIQNAVEESMKNERLKTDLITNVSHDIKTPLTSIINYVGLLKQENFEDEKIQGYLEILDAKTQKLKTLTEDVVEASKISSGNITLNYMDINLVELIHQTTGEFLEKFQKRDLEILVDAPDEPVIIRADSRRIWRIVENLYNNAAKYAMPGTRIYADVTMSEKMVVFSMKNTSEQPLNFKADELTERFIRGDISRSTEGSGLGLSIAKNLTELMGGKFNLYLDGDLFKVTILFPRIPEGKSEPLQSENAENR